MVTLFRSLKERSQRFSDAIPDLLVPEMVQTDLDALANEAEAERLERNAGLEALLDAARVDLAQVTECNQSRLTRTPCMSHLVSTFHDWALVKAIGKQPLYKQGRPKINHLITFCLQQYYIFDTDKWADINAFLMELVGCCFRSKFVEPDLNRWVYTSLAVDGATDAGSLLRFCVATEICNS